MPTNNNGQALRTTSAAASGNDTNKPTHPKTSKMLVISHLGENIRLDNLAGASLGSSRIKAIPSSTPLSTPYRLNAVKMANKETISVPTAITPRYPACFPHAYAYCNIPQRPLNNRLIQNSDYFFGQQLPTTPNTHSSFSVDPSGRHEFLCDQRNRNPWGGVSRMTGPKPHKLLVAVPAKAGTMIK